MPIHTYISVYLSISVFISTSVYPKYVKQWHGKINPSSEVERSREQTVTRAENTHLTIY